MFESIGQEDQAPHIHKKGMKQNRRLHTTLCKRLDLDILIWKDFIEDQFLHVEKKHYVDTTIFMLEMHNKLRLGLSIRQYIYIQHSIVLFPMGMCLSSFIF